MRALLPCAAFLVLSAAAPAASAFCGFYVAPTDGPLVADASMVALMRDGTRTVLSMASDYRGPAASFAMVVPVPVVLQREDVRTLPHDVFHKLDALTAPRLVEYWEQDPCDNPCANADPGTCGFGYGSGIGLGGVGSGFVKAVSVEAKFAVGEYEIVILGASDSDGLEAWLHEHGYAVPSGAAAALAPYVKAQMKFFVAKVDVTKVKMNAAGVAELSPLRIAYESSDFRLPVRLGLLSAPMVAGKPGKQELVVYVLSPDTRYDVANYPSVFVPTNLDVVEGTRNQFASFYATLFDQAIAQAGGSAVVTEYAWESSSCDPCPTPPLADVDIATLGGDALYPKKVYAPDGSATVRMDGKHSMVLTRLHARYDATTMVDDLVFRAASPVGGGREYDRDPAGMSTGAHLEATNNFQARYVVRHGWGGAIKCKSPERDRWGERPAGAKSDPPPSSATNLAFAKRGTVQLASMITGGMPTFDAVPLGAPAAVTSASGDGELDGAVDADATLLDAGPPADASFADSSPVPAVERGPRGCGCRTTPGGDDLDRAALAGGLLGVAAVTMRAGKGGRSRRRGQP